MKQKIRLTRSQEREERRALGRGMRTSIFALILFWVPLLGLILSSVGFIRINRRITNVHRKRQRVYVVISLVILLICTAALFYEAWIYTHEPYIFTDIKNSILERLTDGGYYGGYYYYDDTYEQYTQQYYENEGAYTYPEDYANQTPETE